MAGDARECRDPADRRRIVGTVDFARSSSALAALDAATEYWPQWNRTPATRRAELLRRAAELFENDAAELVARCIAEAGKTVVDGLAEVREAVDFLRYYAAECERLFAAPSVLRGPTGERNELRVEGRGVFLCISPWNFPVGDFHGSNRRCAGGRQHGASPNRRSKTSLVAGRARRALAARGPSGRGAAVSAR